LRVRLCAAARGDGVDAPHAVTRPEPEGQDVGEEPVVVDDQDREAIVRVLMVTIVVRLRGTGRAGHGVLLDYRGGSAGRAGDPDEPEFERAVRGLAAVVHAQ